jgi:NAD(P)-dependent dehydrogenase (short-subunit alcohol dehydrogenase family)
LPGLQGLGLEYARDLVARGCRLLVLTSRSGELAPGARREFEAAGARVICKAVDAGDAPAMRALLAWMREELPYIQHVAHAAGVSGFAMLQDLKPEEFWEVAAPKVGAVSVGCLIVRARIDLPFALSWHAL